MTKKPAGYTAPAVEALMDVDDEMVIVGKTRCSEFVGNGEFTSTTPCGPLPYTDRADRWQASGASSTGAAAALASYPWLDICVATDTAASIRDPAAISGIYGWRPSWGMFPMDGICPGIEVADTVGLLSRDPSVLTGSIRKWVSKSKNLRLTSNPKRITKILVPNDDLSIMQPEVRKALESFVNSAKAISGGQYSVQYMNMQKTMSVWKGMMTGEEFTNLWGLYQYKHIGKGIMDSYQAKHGGKNPPLGHNTQTTWKKARDTDDAESRIRSLEKKSHATGDYVRHFLGTDTVLMDLMDGDRLPEFREESFQGESQKLLRGKSKNPMVYWKDIPCGQGQGYTCPFDQVSYLSPISDAKEMQTISMGLYGGPGTDLAIADLIDHFSENGLLVSVKPGETAF